MRRLAFLTALTALLLSLLTATGSGAIGQAGDQLPFGAVDTARSTPDGIRVSGWALDPDAPGQALTIHVYVDGEVVSGHQADRLRQDVDQAHRKGDSHGFDVTVASSGAEVCVWAINAGGTRNPLIGCRAPAGQSTSSPAPVLPALPTTTTITPITVAPATATTVRASAAPRGTGTARPFGTLDKVSYSDGTLRVSGWAIDPDTRSDIAVHVYSGQQLLGGVRADSNRPDVDAAHSMGAAHGYVASFDLSSAPAGQICVFAIDNAGLTNPRIGCRSVPGAAAVIGASVAAAGSPAVPAGSGAGRRIVYSNSGQRVWLVEADGSVHDTYEVSGRAGVPRPGTYSVFSKSELAWAGHDGITMRHMVRFARGRSLAIGFHSIPRYASGRPLQTASQLGTYRSAGCVRQDDQKAEALYNWAPVGTTVVVLA